MEYKILVVEDEAVIYERLRKRLRKDGFQVCPYTKSYDEAIEQLNESHPDIVLLDIELQGEKSGLDIAKLLTHKFDIPFIILSSHYDELTIEKSLHTNHSSFIIKSKPVLNIDQVLLSIKTVLHRAEKKSLSFQKEGIIGLTDYLSELKHSIQSEISRVPVKYDEIAYFTIGQYENENKEIKFIKKNYVVFETLDHRIYFLKESLTSLMQNLPAQFVKISGNAIVNIKANNFDGRINGSRIVSGGKTFTISNKYREDFEKKLKRYYQ